MIKRRAILHGSISKLNALTAYFDCVSSAYAYIFSVEMLFSIMYSCCCSDTKNLNQNPGINNNSLACITCYFKEWSTVAEVQTFNARVGNVNEFDTGHIARLIQVDA